MAAGEEVRGHGGVALGEEVEGGAEGTGSGEGGGEGGASGGLGVEPPLEEVEGADVGVGEVDGGLGVVFPGAVEHVVEVL